MKKVRLRKLVALSAVVLMSAALFGWSAEGHQAVANIATQLLTQSGHMAPVQAILGNLTLACIRQRQVDEAAAMLHRALDVVEQTWGGGGLNVAFSAGRELQPWRDVPVVQEANDRLLALMTAS